MTQLTLFPAIACALIVLLLAFWLFAPTAWVARQLNAVGSAIQWLFAKIKGLFSKKPAPSTVPEPVKEEAPPVATILPMYPPIFPNGVIVEPTVTSAPASESEKK